MSSITLITPTSDRPAGIELAKRWIVAQELPSPMDVQWLIVDDGREKANVDLINPNANLRLEIEHVKKPPARSVPLSMRGNVATGLTRVKFDRVAIWEDDDWYPPHWLAWLSARFDDGHELIGEARAKYYNVASRRYRVHANNRHASFCQTAMTGRLVPWLDRRCRTKGGTFLDLDLWKRGPAARRFLNRESTVVGIKGLTGKPGIGSGHRLGRRERTDPTLSVLKGWVGCEAAALYKSFYQG